MRLARAQTVSAGLHVAVVVVLLLLTTRSIPVSNPIWRPVLVFRPLRRPSPQRAGGSNQTVLPARRGAVPPAAHRTFIPPVLLRDPKLPLPITVAFESPTIEINAQQIGDPASLLTNGGLGLHGRNGIGDHGCCEGIGDQNSGRAGMSGGSRRGHQLTPPQLIYKVEPEFSEAARKAKYQGVVVLAIEVDASGHPRNLQVIEQLGLGLDEKAIEAVSQWRFRPGYEDGRPIVTTATVEVRFRLM